KLNSAAGGFVYQRWRSPILAGWPTPKIRRATSLESLSHIRQQSSRGGGGLSCALTELHNRINEGSFSVAAVADRGNKPKQWRKYEYGRRCDEIGRALQGERLEEGDRRSLRERYRQHWTTRDGNHAGGNATDGS